MYGSSVSGRHHDDTRHAQYKPRSRRPHSHASRAEGNATGIICLVINPLTAGTDYFRFLHFLLAYCISAVEDIK